MVLEVARGGEQAWWARLVDDAAVFPPGNASLDEALAAYVRRRAEPWSALVGPLVVRDETLPELDGLLARLLDETDAPVPVSVVCSGGAGTLEPAARWADGVERVSLHALEVALRDLDDLPGGARRVTAAADAVAATGADVPVHVEVPPLPDDARANPGWLTALDEIATADLRLKFRTGGPQGALTPSPEALAAQVEAALDRELAFKCTAGLHHAVRRPQQTAEAGRAEHGFLNVLLATRASLDGEDVVATLAETDPETLLAHVERVGADALGRARRWFTSFGCCGVEDPRDDLAQLGLLR